MDFDSRMERIDEAIRRLSSAKNLNLGCPPPLSTSEWKNSQSREAVEELFQSLDQSLMNYNFCYLHLIERLKKLKLELQSKKLSSLLYHRYTLLSLSREEKAEYLRTTKIDPSVRRLL